MTYNAEGKRTSLENLAGQIATTAWDCCFAYGYNEKSELTNAVAAVDSDYRYDYAFDDIGNRESSSERGTIKNIFGIMFLMTKARHMVQISMPFEKTAKKIPRGGNMLANILGIRQSLRQSLGFVRKGRVTISPMLRKLPDDATKRK